jgi:hypothetical protein
MEQRHVIAALEQAEHMRALYRDRYVDFNVRHSHEKLREEHSISLSYTWYAWVKLALQGARLVEQTDSRGCTVIGKNQSCTLPGSLRCGQAA